MDYTRPDLEEALHDTFGFAAFRPGQRESVEAVLAGENVLVIMPTGAGKSLCYQLPAALLDGVTLVVSPLIALMKDQVDALMARERVRATFVNSSLSSAEQRRRRQGMTAGEWKLVYVAPERFRQRDFVAELRQVPLALFVVDEAHCISEWGHDFRPDYLHLRETIHALDNPPVMALTATATPRVQQDIQRQLDVGELRCVLTGFDRPNLTWEVRYAWDQADKLRHLTDLLAELDGSGLVYVGSRSDAEEVALYCETELHRKVGFYHGGLNEQQRTRAHEAFLSDETPLFVATKAFGMGIDKADIRFVIHYTLPSSLEAYYQEAGRAGRDGKPARCTLIYLPEDRSLQEYFLSQDARRPEWCLRLFAALEEVANNGRVRASHAAVQKRLGLRDEQIALAIDSLRREGALEVEEENDVYEFRLRKRHDASLFRAVRARTREHLDQKRRQLEALLRYAETNNCRRRELLAYFGDRTIHEPDVVCCDICNAAAAPQAPGEATEETTRIAQAILRAAATARPALGREKLCGLLAGSKAKWVRQSRAERSPVYGALADHSQAVIRDFLLQLGKQGYLKIIGGKFPVAQLTPRGVRALAHKEPIALALPPPKPKEGRPKSRQKLAPGGSLEETLRLFREGLDAAEIARRRGLVLSTIEGHLAELIRLGKVPVEQVAPPEVIAQIEPVARRLGLDFLRPLKEALPDEITYAQLRAVVNHLRRQRDEEEPEPDEAVDEESDPVERFLRADHPRPLAGDWEVGFALGYTSRFVGDRRERTPIGQLVYQYKYEGAAELVDELSKRMADFLAARAEYQGIDLVAPIPGTMKREGFNPVPDLARRLADRLGVAAGVDVLTRVRTTRLQKELTTQVQKRENIAGAMRAEPQVRGRTVLLIDDFYDSGETLREGARALRAAGAARVLVLTLGKTIHR